MELPFGPINDFSTKSQPDNILLVARPGTRRSVSWARPWRDQPPLPGHRPTAPFCIHLARVFRGCRVGHDYRNHPLHRSRRFSWRWRLSDNGNHSHHVFFDCVGRVDIIDCWFEHVKKSYDKPFFQRKKASSSKFQICTKNPSDFVQFEGKNYSFPP